jgi:uncharacterized protein (DUF934 family)
MNIYTGLLFLHGHILDADQFAEPAHAAADYGPSYGNRVANARVLRERYGFKGELRASGDVLREQAQFLLRCGFDAFEASDGSTPEQWEAATRRFRHVYQRGADDRVPAFVERRG